MESVVLEYSGDLSKPSTKNFSSSKKQRTFDYVYSASIFRDNWEVGKIIKFGGQERANNLDLEV